MADETMQPQYLYAQVAARLAEEIVSGVHPPGSLMPSESAIMERYGISRVTARAAIAELRTMGLIESKRGKGSIVREETATATLDQTITRRGKNFATYGQYTTAEDPHVTRTHLSGTEADLLKLPDDAAFAIDRLLTDSATGRAHHRTLIPFATADQYPELAENPTLDPAAIYGLLTAAGQTLTWQEYTTARPALPDDRTSLAGDGSWLLVNHRITHGTDDQPLILETLTASADRTRLTRHVTAQRTPVGKAN
ncbi:GntR family transcriptional regulator [Streptomyces sp. NBC_00433]